MRTLLHMMPFRWKDALQEIYVRGVAIQKILERAKLLPQLQLQKMRKMTFHYHLRSDRGLGPDYQIDLGQRQHRADQPDFNRLNNRARAALSLPSQANGLAL